MKSIIQIVPQLPPAINGLGDYALNLARQFRLDHQLDTIFVVGNPSWTGSDEIEGFKVFKVPNRDCNSLISLLSQLPTSKVLLHYVGYGYEKRGCPFWLVQGLENLVKQNDQTHLVTMFHEVAASSKFPWHSSFWSSGQQRDIAKRLAILSNKCITSKELYRNILLKLSQGKHSDISYTPVFSNIGEPKDVRPLSKRKSQLVIFGGQGWRYHAYYRRRSELEIICEYLGIEEIVDIGIPIELNITQIGHIPIRIKGKLSSVEVSEIFSDSLAGFLDYPADFLGKSTIFAAYCAHGLLPINPQSKKIPVDGIQSGKHYWCPKDKHEYDLNRESFFQSIADQAYYWYQNHSLKLQAKLFKTML